MSQVAQVIALLTAMVGQLIKNERLAAAGSAIVPGMLVEEVSGKVQEHSTAGGAAQKLFALPNLSLGGTIDDAYAVGDTVSYGAAHSGQEVSALVADGASAIADGARLQSAGDGTLELFVAQSVDESGSATVTIVTDNVVAYAMEAVDNSGGSANVRIKVRVA